MDTMTGVSNANYIVKQCYLFILMQCFISTLLLIYTINCCLQSMISRFLDIGCLWFLVVYYMTYSKLVYSKYCELRGTISNHS